MKSENIKNYMFVFISFILIIIVMFIDEVTKEKVDLAPFYLIISGFCVWFSGRKAGIFISLVSFFIWEYEDIRYRILNENTFFFTWNLFVRSIIFITVITFVHVIKEMYLRERKFAYTDSLTGAANRRKFFDFLEYQIKRLRRNRGYLTIAYFDIDGFKQLNDSYGHNEGDRVLKETVKRVTSNIRDIDLFARIGGDEFVIVLPDCDENNARYIIERVRNNLNNFISQTGIVTFSFGIITTNNFSYDSDSLLHLVDKLMYEIKKSGKNGVKYALFS